MLFHRNDFTRFTQDFLRAWIDINVIQTKQYNSSVSSLCKYITTKKPLKKTNLSVSVFENQTGDELLLLFLLRRQTEYHQTVRDSWGDGKLKLIYFVTVRPVLHFFFKTFFFPLFELLSAPLKTWGHWAWMFASLISLRGSSWWILLKMSSPTFHPCPLWKLPCVVQL